VVVAGVVVLAVFTAVAVGGVMFLRHAQAKREAVVSLQKSVAEEREKIAQSIKDRNFAQGDASVGHIKDTLDASTSQLSGVDAAATRAMSKFLGKFQERLHEYGAAAEQLKQQKVLSWDVRERATIETDRQIVHDFMDSNARLKDMLEHSEGLLSAALDAEKVPPQTRNATVAGYAKSQVLLFPLLMRVRQGDQTIGENALAALDLLEVNWGKWTRDESTGHLRFENTVVRDAFNDHIRKINAAGADQRKAQEEMLAHSKPAAGQ